MVSPSEYYTNYMDMGKGVVVSGMQSGSGKTTVQLMLLSAFRKRGLSVQPFKIGPDYIDTAFAGIYSGVAAYNLDYWLMGEKAMSRLAFENTRNCYGFAEGVMGLIDGVGPNTNDGSTLGVAQLLDWPVILVVPAAKQGRSLRAVLHGFLLESGPGRICGIILNNVSGASHADYLREVLSDFPVPIVGAITRSEEIELPERHLGLCASQENEGLGWREFAKLGERYLDIDRIISLLDGFSKSEFDVNEIGFNKWFSDLGVVRLPETSCVSSIKNSRELQFEALESVDGTGLRLGVAQDEAFHFYYRENIEVLRKWGFELIEFSPLVDSELPLNLDGIVLGGGFPETHANVLQDNVSMRHSICRFIEQGGACYAECGGFMYLCEGIELLDGKAFEMVGVVPGHSHMTTGLRNFGYSECVKHEGLTSFRAHEFHHSEWDRESECANLWTVKKASRNTERMEGYGSPNLHASYLHLYFPNAGSLFRDLFVPKKS